jgi:hypothetical protein
MRWQWLAGAAALAFVAGIAVSQPLVTNVLSGNEVILGQIGGPGGGGIFIPVPLLRNAQGVTTSALTTGTINLTPVTATLLTTQPIGAGGLTVNTPTMPVDGEIFELANASGSNNTGTVTLTASPGQTVIAGAIATQANQTSAEWRYNLATTTWYRIR